MSEHTHLRVVARPAGGFRRCGVRWTAEPQEKPKSAFTVAQIEQLKAEPQLVVTEVTPEAKGEQPKKAAGAAK